jgi:hypothetical protein
VCDIATDIGRIVMGAEDLLLKAIRSLPQHEQDEVMRSIVGRAFAGGEVPPPIEMFPPQGPDVAVAMGPAFDTSKQMTAPLLVRLPADLHDRLRRWSTTNGFSMAAVARGLIERFLNEQDRVAR